MAVAYAAAQRRVKGRRKVVLSPDAQRIRTALVQVARREGVMSYREVGGLCRPVLDMSNEEDQRRISLLLGEISDEEARHHRPLLPALVIHKDGSSPGAGFYEAAARAGYFKGGADPVARLTFFVKEMQRVHAYAGTDTAARSLGRVLNGS